jgi:hypothetical protein
MDLHHHWNQTRAYLAQARAYFPPVARQEPLCQALAVYDEWLEHNELELALDELIAAGQSNPVAEGYWQSLLAAAEHMQLLPQTQIIRDRLVAP